MKHTRFRTSLVRLSGRKPWSALLALVLIALISSSAIIAQRERSGPETPPLHRKPESSQLPPAAPMPNGPETNTKLRGVSLLSLTPTAPSKEYIHFGGKLLAVEEPAP